MEIREILKENAQDLNLPNEPFSMPGRLIPSLRDGQWRYRVEFYDKAEKMTFPDENYDFDALSKNSIIFGAYEDGECVGIAIYQVPFFKYLYLYDLKINASARRKGCGRALIQAGIQTARDRGCRGIYTQAQDNNLNACKFYLGCGFRIGGFDNRVYDGTSQQGKADIFFYLDEEEFHYDGT